MIKKVKKIFYILNKEDRKKIILLLFMVIMMAFLEMVGVASIMPFISVLVNPELIETNYFLNIIFKTTNLFGIETHQEFLYFLGICSFFLLMTSIVFKALTIYVQTKFNANSQFNIASRIMELYLGQPYVWFLNRNSAELGKNILSEVQTVTSKGLNSFINLITQICTSTVLITLLIFVDFKLTIIGCLLVGGFYIFVYFIFGKYNKKLGKKRFNITTQCFTIMNESFSSIKELKVSNLEKVFLETFVKPSKNLAKISTLIDFIGRLPRLVIEIITFGGLILMVLFLMTKQGSLISALPTITVFILVAYRLIPAMQTIYQSISQLNYVGPSIDNMYHELKNLNFLKNTNHTNLISLKDNISLKNVSYQYPDAPKASLANINLTISAGAKVGIIGTTGSGKTTLVDIILGLLEVTKGQLLIDDKKIDKNNIRNWQRNIGYVPQQIFLSDKSISNNIAFGINPDNVNQSDIEEVSKIANLHNFVINELPLKYDTIVGERGVRLSGGQIQRIGIARALYKKPELLILDESTSALDHNTEQLVMNEIFKLKKNMTIIIIAHRLSTLKKCDVIFRLEKGKINNKGTFENLVAKNY
jgi:ABC-type multidrug transport system fused ATPase/permease subunit